MAGWYIRRGDSVIGPADLAKLKELAADGRLLPTDQLAKDAAGPWATAAKTNLFAPRPGTNVMPPARRPQPFAPNTENVPAPTARPVQDQPANVGAVADAAQSRKSIIATIGRGTLSAGGAIARSLATHSQRRHELKLAKIQAEAASAPRPFHTQRIVMAIAAGLGIIGVMLPWAEGPFIGSISGTSCDDGRLVLCCFLPGLLLAFVGKWSSSLSAFASVCASAGAVVSLFVARYRFHDLTEKNLEAGKQIIPFHIAIGSGIYLIALAGVVVIVTAFSCNRLAKILADIVRQR